MASPLFEHVDRSGSVTGPPSASDYAFDRIFRGIAWASAAVILALVGYIIVEIGGEAWPAMRAYGLGFLTSTTWNVQTQEFGILPEIWGIFLSQDFLPPRLAVVFRTIIDMLAAIPSVVFGLWGIYTSRGHELRFFEELEPRG